MWAVLTRLKKPIPDRYPARACGSWSSGSRRWRSCALYEDGEAPDRLTLAAGQGAQEARSPALYQESDAYPNYEGRTGASAREIKTALFNAAQNPEHDAACTRWRCSRS